LDREVDTSKGIFNAHSGETLADLFAEIDAAERPENARIIKAFEAALENAGLVAKGDRKWWQLWR
jgi:hypothetical protein